jgi:predicted ATPase
VFWRGYLERLNDSRPLGELLGALERRDLVRRDTVSAIEGEQQYTFTHVLIRDVAYDLLPRAARRTRHEQCALFLEETTAEVGEAGTALARHWRDAGEPAKALVYFIRAAERAEQGWAKDRAVTLYREALDLSTDEDQQRLLRRRLAVAQQQYLHLEDARALGGRQG